MQDPAFRCPLCSSRATVVTIPEEERQDHVDWHGQGARLQDWEAADVIQLLELANPEGYPRVILVRLDRATSNAWDPASTRRRITGPATLTYEEHPDGGVSLRVREG